MNHMCRIGNRTRLHPRRDARYESQQMIVISTGHVSESTARIFDEQSTSAERPIASMVWEYGWLVYIGDGIEGLEHYLPRDLVRCVRWASQHYPLAQWLRFDRNADRIGELPWFDW